MAERKVQSKYMPADFDHRVLKVLQGKEPKQKANKQKKESVRIMLPFNVCCSNCNSYMYRGRKFNGKKEEGVDPDYLGTKVLRFHFKCETCASPIVYRTDPKSSGFVMVSGGRENKTSAGMFNPLADVVEIHKSDAAAKQKGSAAGLDAVEALEKRALETKRERQVMEELELELQRGRARMVAAQVVKAGDLTAIKNKSASEAASKSEESDPDMAKQLDEFREKKRALEFQAEPARPSSSSSLSLTASVSKHSLPQGNRSQDAEEGLLVVQKAAKKPKMQSLVPYDDDDE